MNFMPLAVIIKNFFSRILSMLVFFHPMKDQMITLVVLLVKILNE